MIMATFKLMFTHSVGSVVFDVPMFLCVWHLGDTYTRQRIFQGINNIISFLAKMESPTLMAAGT